MKEEMEVAKKQKFAMISIMTNCYPKKVSKEELSQKTLKQLTAQYEKLMGEKWVYDPESPWM